MERKEINKRMRADKNTIMNDKSEIFGLCKCKMRFHKFCRREERDTEDRLSPEKSIHLTPTRALVEPPASTLVALPVLILIALQAGNPPHFFTKICSYYKGKPHPYSHGRICMCLAK